VLNHSGGRWTISCSIEGCPNTLADARVDAVLQQAVREGWRVADHRDTQSLDYCPRHK
jgi:hypothetical protein